MLGIIIFCLFSSRVFYNLKRVTIAANTSSTTGLRGAPGLKKSRSVSSILGAMSTTDTQVQSLSLSHLFSYNLFSSLFSPFIYPTGDLHSLVTR